MRLSDLLRCSKPLLFEDGFEGFEYSGGGTFFFGKFHGRFFAFTAKHCLEKRNPNLVRLMFDELSSSEDKFLSINKLYVVDEPACGPEDYAQVVAFELDVLQLSEEQLRSEWFVDFDYLIGRDLVFSPRDMLVTRGFPRCLGGIDYDLGIISVQSLSFDGIYGGRTSDVRVHKFIFLELEHVDDINGMSGSPVFVVRPVPGGLDYLFAGMIIRGAAEARLCRFIDCSIIYSLLYKLERK